MKTFIIASNNSHKVIEIKEILKDMDFNVISLKDAGITIDVEEDGKTFKENSYKKAKEIKDYLKKQGKHDFFVMADDSGLEVNYLNGEPGIYSARYAGVHGDNKANNIKLLTNMTKVPAEKRGANFICSIVVLSSDEKEIIVEGKSYGIIAENLCGVQGFGYDPLFYVPEFNKTFAEMTADEKNSISHRGRALEKLKIELNKILK